MKKIIFTNLPRDINEDLVRKTLEHLGEIKEIHIIRDGDPNRSVVTVLANISDDQAFELTSQVKDYWFCGRLVSAYLILHPQ